jgi:threonine dehydratase
LPTLHDVFLARSAIRPLAHETELRRSSPLSAYTGRDLYLKLENRQRTGSFKIRGAANRLLSLTPEERTRGVVTVSTGNHGRAVAYAARHLGMRAVICVPELVLPHKVAAIRALDAEVIVAGRTQDDAEQLALDLSAAQGLTLVSPFDDPQVIAGQGTIALELLDVLPDIATVIVPLSGGGLIGGIALALKSVSSRIHVVGVSMERGPAMYDSLLAGHPVPVEEEPTLADSLIGGIGLDNRYTFPLVQKYVDEVVLVNEDEIAAAMVYAVQREQMLVEGGGAVGLAMVLAGKATPLSAPMAVVISGGNVDKQIVVKLIAGAGRETL